MTYIIIISTILISIAYVQSDEDSDDEIPINPNDLYFTTEHFQYDSSQVQTEGLKALEPEEAKKRLGILFERIDDNKNGSICKQELSNWIMQSLKKKDAEHSATNLQEMDENHDKSISLNEYLTKSYGHTEKELANIIKYDKEWKVFLKRIMNDKARFSLADKNNNNLLDFEEFIKFNFPEHYAEMAPAVLNQTLTHIDINKDGLVDLEEFLRDEYFDNETVSDQKQVFSLHDKNNNGVLEKDEIMEWISLRFVKSVQIEVDRLFNKTDANNDNKLNKEEVIDQHDLWIGSRATDHGRHLDYVKQHEEL